MLWSHLVEVTRASLFVLAHWCGGSFGTAILIVSALVRIGMLPVTVRAARRRIEREKKLAALAPELERIKRRYAAQPDRMFAETRRVYAANDLSFFDGRDLVAGAVQFPPAALLYAAVRAGSEKAGRFLWLADLAKPDRVLAMLATVLAALMAWSASSSAATRSGVQLAPVIVTSIITFMILSHLSAGLALYSIANSVVGSLERAIVGRSSEKR